MTFCSVQAPERILDAPDIGNDYYLHLVDWSSHNHLAVALGAHIYLWNAATGEIVQLCQLEAEDEVVTSVKWAREGSYLAVGSSTGAVQLWDVASMKRCELEKLSLGNDTNSYILGAECCLGWTPGCRVSPGTSGW